MTVIVEANKDGVVQKLAETIAKIAEKSIQDRGVFNVGVSGGSLAAFLSTGLPTIQSDFSKWKIFFCDERLVPENDPDSTFGLYKKNLVDSGKLGLNVDQFVQAKQNVTAEEAASDYENQIALHFKSKACPQFDLLLLGMGPDGHTCSLFPNHPLLGEVQKFVAAISDSPKPPPNRITLTFPVLNNARHCIFAMCGKEKAAMVKRILVDKEDLPAARVQPKSGEVVWILDSAAAADLN